MNKEVHEKNALYGGMVNIFSSFLFHHSSLLFLSPAPQARMRRKSKAADRKCWMYAMVFFTQSIHPSVFILRSLLQYLQHAPHKVEEIQLYGGTPWQENHNKIVWTEFIVQ
ncbi:MAG: hypothetical protein ACYC6R_14915 [Anaerolineales bacterium]